MKGLNRSLYDLVFLAKNIPPFGIKYYYIQGSSEKRPTNSKLVSQYYGTPVSLININNFS